MAKKIKDIGLGKNLKQPKDEKVFETNYPTFKQGQATKVLPIVVSVSPKSRNKKTLIDF